MGKGIEMVDLTYDHNYVVTNAIAIAGGDGMWKRSVVDVASGETAYLPGTTKRGIPGPVRLEYTIHPSGITVKRLSGPPVNWSGVQL